MASGLFVAWPVRDPAAALAESPNAGRLSRLIRGDAMIAVRASQLRERPEVVVAVSRAWIATTE
jgi:hypothetical protein